MPEDSIIPAKDGRPSFNRRLSAASTSEWLAKSASFLFALVSIITTAGIIYVLFTEAWTFFTSEQGVSVFSRIGDFFTGQKWEPKADPPKYGVLPLLSGTLLITLGSGLIALPLGLMTAVYLSEYASEKVRGILKPTLEILAGVPTVVYGYLGLFFITPLLRNMGWDVKPFNAAAGAIVVGIMTLPLVSSLCEDALAAVPKPLREGAYGIGSTKFEVIKKIVIPAGLSGIMASFILALSRAIGETMAVTLAAGQTPNLTMNPGEDIQTMTAYIVNVSSGDAARGTAEYQTIFAVGAALFLMTFFMNILAHRVVKKFRKVYS